MFVNRSCLQASLSDTNISVMDPAESFITPRDDRRYRMSYCDRSLPAGGRHPLPASDSDSADPTTCLIRSPSRSGGRSVRLLRSSADSVTPRCIPQSLGVFTPISVLDPIQLLLLLQDGTTARLTGSCRTICSRLRALKTAPATGPTDSCALHGARQSFSMSSLDDGIFTEGTDASTNNSGPRKDLKIFGRPHIMLISSSKSRP